MKKTTKNKKAKMGIREIIKNSKAQKIIIASLATILCITTVLLVIFCEPKHPIEKFAHKIMKKQNFQMEINISGIPIFGAASFVIEMDGKVIHVPEVAFTEEYYIEAVGDDHYTYTKDKNGKWVKEKSEDGSFSDFLENETLQQFLNPDNYELVEDTKNIYRQKADVEIEGYRNITITLEKDFCKIEMIALSDGMTLETQIIISKIGEMDLKIPSVG